jgi:hypothetical protein
MEHPDRATAERARAVVAQFQQNVQAWMDADRVLPADGLSLLALLDRALAGGAGAGAVAAEAAIEAVIGRVEALIEAGALEAAISLMALETARAFLAAPRMN